MATLRSPGVYRAADFWLNGVWVGHHESGETDPYKLTLGLQHKPILHSETGWESCRMSCSHYWLDSKRNGCVF